MSGVCLVDTRIAGSSLCDQGCRITRHPCVGCDYKPTPRIAGGSAGRLKISNALLLSRVGVAQTRRNVFFDLFELSDRGGDIRAVENVDFDVFAGMIEFFEIATFRIFKKSFYGIDIERPGKSLGLNLIEQCALDLVTNQGLGAFRNQYREIVQNGMLC